MPTSINISGNKSLLFLVALVLLVALSGCGPQYPGDPDPSKLGDRKPAAGANEAPVAGRNEGR